MESTTSSEGFGGMLLGSGTPGISLTVVLQFIKKAWSLPALENLSSAVNIFTLMVGVVNA